MTIVDLIRDEAGDDRRRILMAACVAGATSMFVLIGANVVAGAPKLSGLPMAGLFALVVVGHYLSAKYVYYRTATVVESALHRIKTRIVDKIEKADIQGIERIGTAEIHDGITENLSVVSNYGPLISAFLQAALILVFAVLYVAWISLPTFIAITFLLAIGYSTYRDRAKELERYLQRLGDARVAFFDRLTDLLKGFKEVKLSRRRGRDLCTDIERSSEALQGFNLKSGEMNGDNFIFASCNLYALLGVIVLVIPQHLDVDSSALVSIVAAILFLWGPMTVLITGAPAYIRSNVALDRAQTLEEKLDKAIQETRIALDVEDPWKGGFGGILGRGIEFEYVSEDGDGAFRIGPLDVDIAEGEIVFIVGGNGSGKSTALKVLTGLYPPTGGELLVGGIRVDSGNVAAYREKISAIYSDFHLFAKLYGLLDVDPAAVHRLIAQMELQQKTSFENQGFTNRNLSTGQRKRLAMIVALLEDRPICVFDEWAADQDPEFRAHFYEELLPALKQRGKTVIAVTHDDRFFHCADRVITMEYGRIRSVERT
ncbi:cyclic peptide export ABC transporter [Polyangium sp. y55x31]|uniref:cyclic peptide export ABC transporter n=1 Tax=Polyangium sp. y55x31 TaxID=3042688 RepID=UPI0024823D1C|nr:cyclic peptide export ABC transporter [Polyangium sp. y55x31]MDI1475890.1 cyclic peptide export ABC transporter [Polyangium sp. y55x31]